MRIGLIAPPWLPVPPPAYGGTEAVIDYLARGLVARGHSVRLFTVGESTCPVPSASLYRAAVEPLGAGLPEAAHVLAAYEELADMDVIHDHTILGPLLARSSRPKGPPIVVTNHGPFTTESRRAFAVIARYASVVAISHAQARCAGPRVPIAAVIHHGIDLDLYRAGRGDGDFVLFIGRMCADKGVHRAIRIARRAGQRLILVSKMREHQERRYFEEQVRPLLAEEDEAPRELPLAERLVLLRHARALVNPIQWAEPFGLVMAEALASATPVLAFPRGAAPEIVDHGRTGFLCRGDDEMVDGLSSVADLSRDHCRAAAEQRFGMERMAADYEHLYRAVLAAGPGRVRTGQREDLGVGA